MTGVLLAIDTSSGTGVAVLVDGKVVAENYKENTMAHAEQIGIAIRDCLQAAGKKAAEVTAVAVGVGPAPFTGLRVGIAAAKMFAEGVGVPILGISSLDAIAFDIELEQNTLVLTDARRSEVYFALYCGKSRAGVPKLIDGPGVQKRVELEQRLKDEGISYRVVEGQLKPASLGLLALAGLSEGSKAAKPLANYLRAPDAVPAKGKKVSG